MGSSLSSSRLKQHHAKHQKINQAHQQDYINPSFISLKGSIEDTNNDPMLAAANMISQRYENERATSMNTVTSGEHCVSTTIDTNNHLASNVSTPSTATDRVIAMFPEVIVDPTDHTSVTSSKAINLKSFLNSKTEIDKRRERDRQQRLHYTLKRAFNGIYNAGIEDPKLIVDWSCGIGVWDMEMAEKFPDCKIIAIDFTHLRLSHTQDNSPNLEFRKGTIDETHTGMESIESDTVDYVMMKDCWLINSPLHKWTNVLDQAFRILKPNGWIELSENALCLESQGKMTAKLDTYFGTFCDEMNIDRNIAEKLGGLLEFSGFNSIEKTEYTIPVGDWSVAKDSKEMGFLFKDILEKRYRGIAKWLSVLNDVEEREIQRLITISVEEEIITNRSHINWFSYTARKFNNKSCSNKSNVITPNTVSITLTPTTSQQNATSQSLQI